MKSHSIQLKTAAMAAAVMACMSLVGCAGQGSLAAGDGRVGVVADGGGTLTPDTTPETTAAGDIATSFGGIVTSAGGVLGNTGSVVTTLGDVIAGDANNGAASGLGGVLQHTGGAVTAVGSGVIDGLGQVGSTPDHLNPTLSGVPAAVVRVGSAVASGGSAVSAIDNINGLNVLRPVTDPAGNAVDITGQLVSSTGNGLGEIVNNTAIRRVTAGGSSSIIVPVVETVFSTTQAAGAATQLGQPADNLLTSIGAGVTGLGNGISSSNTSVLSQTGQLVSSTGGLISSLGGTVNAPAGGDASSGSGSVSNVISPVINAVDNLGSAVDSAGPSVDLLTPVTNLLGGVLR